MTRIRYRQHQSPPYPGLKLRLTYYGGSHECEAKIDTGASRTCIPRAMLEAIGAACTGPSVLHAYDGSRRRTWMYRLDIEVIETGWPQVVPSQFRDTEVCAIETPADVAAEVLIGRDLLRNWSLLLEGPRDTLHVQP